MTRDETIALYERAQAAEKEKRGEGSKVWNAWAAEMLSQKSELENSDTGKKPLVEWRKLATVVFDGNSFEDARFEGFVFPGPTRFQGSIFKRVSRFDRAEFNGEAEFHVASFEGTARFEGATFKADAVFHRTTFEGTTLFDRTTFERRAWFNEATFNGTTRFREASFKGITVFMGATFHGMTSFIHAHFWKHASFRAVVSRSTFFATKASFDIVPDFIQATFSEVPRFDNVHISQRSAAFIKRSKINADVPARYRALKGLAVRGHDHDSELGFFAGEIKSRRGVLDFALPRPWNVLRAWKTVERPTRRPKRQLVWRWQKGKFAERAKIWPGAARYWAGWFYQVLSNFGRSLVLPLLWWAVALAGFAVAYLWQHIATAAQTRAGYAFSTLGWVWMKALSCIPFAGFPAPPPLTCISTNPIVTAATEPWAASVYLSVRRALIFNTGDDQDKLTFAYACLFGDYSKELTVGQQATPAFRVIPHIPDAVSALAISQSLLSAALIFLFFLAVRNQFRIK